MTAILPPPTVFLGLTSTGLPLAFGKLYTYAAGTTTPLATYTDHTGATPNANPTILDASGRANIWLGSTGAYKFVLKDASDVVQWTVDGIDPSAYSNDALLAQAISCFAGALPPANPVQGQLWYQPSVKTLWTYNGTTWDATCQQTAFVLQTYQAFTSAGTAPAFTLAPSPALTAYGTGQRFRWKFHTDGTAGSNTGNISGLGAKNFKQYNSAGSKVAAVIKSGMLADVEYDGTDLVILNPLQGNQIQPITATVGSSALTVTLGDTALDFRSATLGSGTVTSLGTGSVSVVVPSGATLGCVNAKQSRIAVLALNNAGTVELAVVNLSGGNNLDETTLISTTALSAAADVANVIYSTSARTNVPFRVVGFVESTQATAGTWATAPSTIQGAGGNALTSLSSIGYGQTWQDVTASRAMGTTYYNTTGRPIAVDFKATSGNYFCVQLTINGVVVFGGAMVDGAYGAGGLFIVPPGASYVAGVSVGTPTLHNWLELR